MKNIKAIAFDLVGVLLKENDIKLDETDSVLESKFGLLNTDRKYFEWATSTFNKSQEEIKKRTEDIINTIYEIREPDLFTKIPNFLFATATNHLSYIDIWLKQQPIGHNFSLQFNSAIFGVEKPDIDFFERLAKTLALPSHEILFIDDNQTNCEAAISTGMNSIHYKQNKLLSEVIHDYIR